VHERICSPQTASTLRDLLVGVVEGGTGDNIKNETYAIAGKTGTAETAPGASTSNVTFVGFFPANKPKYTCLVMMRDVGHVFGRNVAPVFLDIADCVVSLDKDLDCRPTLEHLAEKYAQKGGSIDDPPTVSKAPQATLRRAYRRMGLQFSNIAKSSRWCYYEENNNENENDSIAQNPNKQGGYLSYRVPKGQMPNCYGMTIRDALLLCRSVGVDVSFEGYGKVYSQEPKARTALTNNNKVHLKLKP
jgi:cell division protein FtsI (penicillin-binding protein 3)